MNVVRITFLTLLFSVVLAACKSQSCDKLPVQFESYEAAKRIINSTTFRVSESVDTRKSSWVRSAAYKSCDGKTGFMILNLNGNTYIHQDVPYGVWCEFKKAASFGGYYNMFIKGKYYLKVN